MLPASKLSDAADGAIDGTQPRAVTLAPDHALMLGGRDLAASLDQFAIGIEQKLRVVNGSAVALVDTDRDDNSGLSGSFGDGVDRWRRHRHRLIEQFLLLGTDDVLHRCLNKRKIWVVGNDRLGEGGKLDALVA